LDRPAPARQSIVVDIIVPVYNEEETAESFHKQLQQALASISYTFKIIYIDDGSTDNTLEILETIALQDERVSVIELSRNFGQQAALTAGLDIAEGDYVITMDGDGQHPPSLIAEMLQLASSGYDMVLTQRLETYQGPAFKQWTSNLFYRLINLIGDTQILPGSADFRLLSKPVVKSLRELREYHRLIRGMVAWVGYRSIILPYEQPLRLGGKSKYSLHKLLRLAMNAVFSFSLVPLYIGISVGIIFLFLAVLEMVYVLSFWVTGQQAGLAPGWSSLMFVLLVVGGSLMIALGFIGIYIGYIFQEVKQRPIYLVRRAIEPHREKDGASTSKTGGKSHE
jgi:polyisoprenyl-phosphate glycosyltransferase